MTKLHAQLEFSYIILKIKQHSIYLTKPGLTTIQNLLIWKPLLFSLFKKTHEEKRYIKSQKRCL